MLALTRKKQESIILNFNGTLVKVIIADVRSNGAVKLAIDAPASVSVDREEIYLAKMGASTDG